MDYEELARSQSTDEELSNILNKYNSSLQLQLVNMPTTNTNIYCDMSIGKLRHFLTKNFRRQIFDSLHGLSHPGIRSTVKLICGRFGWPSIKKDVANWARSCMMCQKSKVQRHITSPHGKFDFSSKRFCHLHIDIVVPLPISNGFSYCLTVVDKFSRWPEVIPLVDITAETVIMAFYSGWICRYGVPVTVITDQGRQFESNNFQKFAHMMGFQRKRTIAYNPAANGLVERFHRTLKAAINSHQTERWTEVLPIILLGYHCAIKEDIGGTPADLDFGTTLRLPGEFFDTLKLETNQLPFVA